MIQAYINMWKKGVSIEGRISRSEFWLAILANALILLPLILLGLIRPYLLLIPAFYLVMAAIPFYTMLLRRLHDAGFSGWWMLLAILPAIGETILLVLALFDSNADERPYGPGCEDQVSESESLGLS